MSAFTLLAVEGASNSEIKPRVPMWSEYGIPSYTTNSLPFPLRCTEYNYIRDNLDRLYLNTTDVHRLQDALKATLKF